MKINKKERKLGVATALQSAVDSVTVVEDITGERLLVCLGFNWTAWG